MPLLSEPQLRELLQSPSRKEWVPFSADVVITHASGGPTAYGRFYRDAHGCGRLETGPKGVTAVIYIHNVPRAEYYWWNDLLAQWTAGPMKLPANGWRPIPRPADVEGLKQLPHFVEVRRGRPYNLRDDSGSFAAYQYVNNGGTLSVQVPELNFFDVLKQNLEGRREAYSNIEMGDQPEELFGPPAGASVVTTSKPGGIIAQSPDSAAEHLAHINRGQGQ